MEGVVVEGVVVEGVVVEGVVFIRRMELRRARRLDMMGEFRAPDVGILFSDNCLVFLRRIRALLEVVVE